MDCFILTFIRGIFPALLHFISILSKSLVKLDYFLTLGLFPDARLLFVSCSGINLTDVMANMPLCTLVDIIPIIDLVVTFISMSQNDQEKEEGATEEEARHGRTAANEQGKELARPLIYSDINERLQQSVSVIERLG